MLTQGRLKKLLHYDPETGKFTWLRAHLHIKIGDEAGTPANGYIRIRVDGKKYRAHRLAWLYMYGTWPADQIDHKDLDKSNNRIDNLRLANTTQNNGNRPLQPNNTSGHRGVYWFKPRQRWVAFIAKKRLGSYRTREEAAAVYADAAQKYFGEFARLG